ncbi:MAG: hypothetical protein JO126_06295 [Alphaproteobacteria bacterium]|nr:hypothetical protein [Alphaproteobacteria bacterium]MBV8549048.1 hypothetical protein [Alphaproteobacteria bacterium]
MLNRLKINDLLKVAGLSLAYIVVFILLSAAIQASQEKTGEAKINFEYRVF